MNLIVKRARLLVPLAVAIFLATLAWIPTAALTWTGPITTIAGSCTTSPCSGFAGDGGPASTAKLAGPLDAAADSAGNLYIADSLNDRIRRIDAATGIITTVAGSGVRGGGGDGGPATAAQLNNPSSVAVDGADNLYIAESGGHRIRKVTIATGLISTIAGTGVSGSTGDNGPAINAALNAPLGVAVDAVGNVYIADTSNFKIRAVAASTGIITTIAGTGISGFSGDGGPGINAVLSRPTGVDADSSGNVYFADHDNHRVRKVATGTGIVSTVAGNGGVGREGDGGLATASPLDTPWGVAVDRVGDVYVACDGNTGQRIRKITTSTGIIKTIAGTGTPPPLPNGAFFSQGAPSTTREIRPRNVAVDRVGNVYEVDVFGEIMRIAAVPVMMTSDVPLLGDIDGDGRADLVVWSVSTGTFRWVTSSSGYSDATAGTKQWGNQGLGDVPLLGDIDGDGKSDLIVWRASTGTWYWLTSSTGYSYAAANGVRWGDQTGGDVPLVGDIDGDAKAELIIWRESTGIWYWLNSSAGYAYPNAAARIFGDQRRADVPLLGDFDGDGRVDTSVWSGNGLRSCPQCPTAEVAGGTFQWSTASTGFTATKDWGQFAARDVPMLGDVDADGKSDLVVWRRSNGTWLWTGSLSGYSPPGSSVQWGADSAGDVPVAGDLDGDGRLDPAVWRASTRTWYWLNSRTGYNYPGQAKPWTP